MSALPDDRTIAQFFFEVGYGACFADAYIRGGNPPFHLTDDIVQRAWTIAGEAHDDPAEWDSYKAKADAAPDLLEALREARKALATAVIANAGGLFDHDSVGEHLIVKQIDAAISRATGEQP